MPVFLVGIFASVAKFLFWILGYLVVKLLALLGISFVTYQGLSLIVDYVKSEVMSLVTNQALSDFIVVSLGIVKFDVVVSILLSALALKITINGLDRATRFVWSRA